MVQRLMMENRIERIRVYSHIHDQKLSYLNKWHQDVDAFYRSNHAESADIINNMQQTLSEYVEAYNTLAQLQKTLDSMGQEGASLDNTIVQKEDNTMENLAAFELQAQEFKKAQEDFSDYMDRLQEDIALKAEKFGHVEFYDARLQDGYSNTMAVAASEVQTLDERRKPLASTNPLLAKESVLLPEPNVENLTYEHLSLNLPSLAINALDEVSRISIEGKQEENTAVSVQEENPVGTTQEENLPEGNKEEDTADTNLDDDLLEANLDGILSEEDEEDREDSEDEENEQNKDN